MSRPLRIAYRDAWYHVMNRARIGQEAFPAKEDYFSFIELIKDTAEMFNLKVSAYCLMPSHYHLLVQTPEANISRCMRHINGVYTQNYNTRNMSDGTLFRGRYKSILVDADSYLLELIRYIHRNPFRAGMVYKLDDYPWSSHKGYLSKSKKWQWLHKDYILDMFSQKKHLQVKIYRQFVSKQEPVEIMELYSKQKMSPILGSDKFIEWVRGSFSKKRKDMEIPESKDLCPDATEIRRVICNYYQIEESELLKTRRGVENEARDLAIYLQRVMRGDRLNIIGNEFNLHNFSSVSSAIERIKRKMKNYRFRKRYDQISNLMRK
jgi:REP element-mobilizing transposase RayT